MTRDQREIQRKLRLFRHAEEIGHVAKTWFSSHEGAKTATLFQTGGVVFFSCRYDFGREFSTGRERFKIVGIETRRPKYPISVERILHRQGYKFAAENIAMLLKAQKNP